MNGRGRSKTDNEFGIFVDFETAGHEDASTWPLKTKPRVFRSRNLHCLGTGLFPPGSGKLKALLKDVSVAAFDFTRTDGEFGGSSVTGQLTSERHNRSLTHGEKMNFIAVAEVSRIAGRGSEPQ